VSVVTNAEGPAIKKREGWESEGRIALFGLAQDVVDDPPVAPEGVAEAVGAAQDGAGAAADWGMLGGRGGIDEGMLDAEGAFECDEGGVDELEDDELGGEEESVGGGHRFLPAGAGLALGG